MPIEFLGEMYCDLRILFPAMVYLMFRIYRTASGRHVPFIFVLYVFIWYCTEAIQKKNKIKKLDKQK